MASTSAFTLSAVLITSTTTSKLFHCHLIKSINQRNFTASLRSINQRQRKMSYFVDDPLPPISDFFPDYYSYSLSIPTLPPDPATLALINSIANINIEHIEMTEEKTQETATPTSANRSSRNRTSPTTSTSLPPAAFTSYQGATTKPLIVPAIPEEPHFFHPISNSLLVESKSITGLPDVKIPRVDAIDEFRVALTEAKGFYINADKNLKRTMQSRTQRDFKSFSLGKPAVRGDSFLVGTDDPTSQDHYLMYLHGPTMYNSRADPVVSHLRVNEHIRDVKWITPSYILAAVGEGRFSVFTKDETDKLEWSRNMNDIHTAHIREMATQPGKPNIVASGGFDRTLCILDLNRPASVCQQRLQADDVIGSVKWPIWNSQICPSVSLDNGHYIMYDLREKASVAFAYNSKIPNMYTHERYTDHNVLLGYLGTPAGGSVMKHIDMRRGGSDKCVISTEIDPWCGGIGGIEYNYASHAFVTSGFTDFTVWKQSSPRPPSPAESSPQSSTVKVWSHGGPGVNTLVNEDGYTVSATWLDADTVVTATSAGGVGLYIQQFA